MILAFGGFSSIVNRGTNWIVMLLMVMFIECEIVERVLLLTLILSSFKTEKVSVFLSTSTSPLHRLAMDSKVFVLQGIERKASNVNPTSEMGFVAMAFDSR